MALHAAESLGISDSAMRRRLKKIGTVKEPPRAGAPPEYLINVAAVIQENKKDVKELNWRDYVDGFDGAKRFRRDAKGDHGYRVVKSRIKTDQPIAVCFISDVHIGSPHTDYQGFLEDIALIESDPRIYVGKGGDWADKMSGFRDATASVGQLHPEEVQLLAVESIMEGPLNGRIIAAIGGNHDRMDARKTGLSSEYWIHRGKPFPYMPTGGLVELTVGSETYRIVWTHQYGTGNSRLNPHNIFRWIRQELDTSGDIFVLEHHHDPSIMTREMQDFEKRTVVEIRTGSYKIDDKFSQQFFKEGRHGPQTVILFPDRHKIVPCHGKEALSDAIVYLNGLGVTG